MCLLSVLVLACSSQPSQEAGAGLSSADGPVASGASSTVSQASAPEIQLLTPAQQGLPPELEVLEREWRGDFDAMAERRVIRVLTVFGKGIYFLDGPEQKGATYELVRMFEDEVNKGLGSGTLRVHVVIIPVTRDRLLPALVEGLGDIAAANLTITPERLERVDFSDPLFTGVSELVVTGPGAPPLRGFEDLAGQQIHVRESSSYFNSLQRLNERLSGRQLEPIELVPAAEHFEDEDLLEMVNAGLLPMVVVDSHKAEFWGQVFDDITPRDDLAVASDGRIGWAFRKDSPQLKAAINEFVRTHRRGTLMGNIVLNRYLRNTDWVANALTLDSMERFRSLIDLFQQFGGMYEFDWLMVAAQGYQESKLDQSVRSSAGAVGVMQLLPSTASDPNVGIPDIEEIENNIHAGVKYLRFVRDRYFDDSGIDAMNQTMFAFAAYNAGPARVSRLRRQAEEAGLDPSQWFRHVELIAAREVGREPVQYVSNIFKYYVAYRLVADRLGLQE